MFFLYYDAVNKPVKSKGPTVFQVYTAPHNGKTKTETKNCSTVNTN
jgi:hypothetical protein